MSNMFRIKGKKVVAAVAALPYSVADYEFVDVQLPEEGLSVKGMQNLTKNRMHTDGSTALYPTFVNLGEKSRINGSGVLFKIRIFLSHPLFFLRSLEFCEIILSSTHFVLFSRTEIFVHLWLLFL